MSSATCVVPPSGRLLDLLAAKCLGSADFRRRRSVLELAADARSWIGAALPADAPVQSAADAVQHHQGTGAVSQREKQSIPQRDAEVGRTGHVQGGRRGGTGERGRQRQAGGASLVVEASNRVDGGNDQGRPSE